MCNLPGLPSEAATERNEVMRTLGALRLAAAVGIALFVPAVGMAQNTSPIIQDDTNLTPIFLGIGAVVVVVVAFLVLRGLFRSGRSATRTKADPSGQLQKR
jgi:O-antigen/teichoic acid export membrane protein